MDTAKRKVATVKAKNKSKTAAIRGNFLSLSNIADNGNGKGYAKILRQIVAVIK